VGWTLYAQFLKLKAAKTMEDTETSVGIEGVELAESAESVEALRQRVHTLEAEAASMRAIVLRVAEARMCRDGVTMIESCPHCSLKRGGEYGYAGKHDPTCIVSQARALGY
jgi:hypothetical protein